MLSEPYSGSLPPYSNSGGSLNLRLENSSYSNPPGSGGKFCSREPTWSAVPPPLSHKKPIVIAIDVDEVLCSYVECFRLYLQRQCPGTHLDPATVFNEAHDPNSELRMQFAMEGGLENLDPVPGAAQALARLRAAGFQLEALTSRPPIMRSSTEELLIRHFPPGTFAAAHFAAPGEKGRECNRIGARALVDDQLPNLIDAAECGVLCVLFDFGGSYQWGHCSPEELPTGCVRLQTWGAVADFLISALPQHTMAT